MKRTVTVTVTVLLLFLLAPPARADIAPPPPDPPGETVLSMVSESERPLGSPPMLAIYVLLAALGVRIAMSRKPAGA